MDGFINILKPQGPTASDMVVRLKKILNQKKIGHLGTLDPGACGVLPIAVGKATKLFDYLAFKRKKYRAFFTFGKTTDTLDSYGALIKEKEFAFDSQELDRALKSMCGEQMQVPPIYSALSVGGTRAYKLARKGTELDLPPRRISIYSFELVRRVEENVFCFDIECSGGTYIRSICRDLADRLGTVGYMSGLIRLASGIFSIADSCTLQEVQDNFEEFLLPVTYPLSELKICHIDECHYKNLSNGVKIKTNMPEIDLFKVYCKGEFWGVGRNEGGFLKIVYYLR